MLTRAAPNSRGVKLISAFLIRMKELPQTMQRTIKRVQANPDSERNAFLKPKNIDLGIANRKINQSLS